MPPTPKTSPTKKSTSSSSSTANANNANNANNNTAAGEYLLERLRILLQRLQSTSEILQNWPETQGDSAKVHADTASQLIASIRKVVLGLRAVERHVNGGKDGGHAASAADGSISGSSMSKEALEAFRSSLEDKCPIPLDLLDLLDVVITQSNPFGMNPQCYARGLMKESMRQLAGLERRKRALAMLAQSIEIGMEDVVRKQKSVVGGGDGEVEDESLNQKRKRYDSEEGGESMKKVQRTN